LPDGESENLPVGLFCRSTIAIKAGTLNSDWSADCRFATHSGLT
jgi:hypothetical protein